MIARPGRHLSFRKRNVRSQELQQYFFKAAMDEPGDLIICTEITPAVCHDPSLQVTDCCTLQTFRCEARTITGKVTLQESNDIRTGERQRAEIIEQDSACS